MSVTIKIEGDGLSYQGETSVAKAAQVVAFINNDANSRSSYESPTPTAIVLETGSRAIGSPREYLLDSQASSNPEKIVVLGKYIATRKDPQVFSIKDLQETFRLAGERMPANITRDINTAISLGLIASSGSRGEYYVTNRGEEQINAKFVGSTAVPRSSAKTTRSNSPRLGLNKDVENLTIVSELEGFPGYWDPRFKDNKSTRILWLLQFASANGLEALSSTDISFMAKKLSDDIKPNTVPSKIIGLNRKGRIAKTTDGRFRILKPGTDFLRAE